MEVLFYATVISRIILAFCKEDSEINFIRKFSSDFLQHVQWSKIIILTDNQDFVYLPKHLSRHLISARIASVNEFDLIELNNFGSVLIISKPQTAIGIVEKALKLRYCPPNWLLILEEKLEGFGNFYIPHDVAVILLDVEHSHEVWFLFRLYSADGNVINAQKSGFWDPKNSALQFSRFSVPLPSKSENVLRLTSIPFEPFFSTPEEDGQLSIGGLHGEILKTIRSEFRFNASVVVPEDKLFGAKVNNSYVSGIVGKVYRNESDVGISLVKTKERFELIDYSPDITRIRNKIMYHYKDKAEERFFFYLEPFSSYLWICVLGFTILFAVLSSIISFIKNKVQQRPKKAISNIKIIYYYVRNALYILINTGIPVEVYGLSGLTSILAVTRLKLPFKSFREFLYNSNYDLATLKDSSMVQILKDSKEDLYVRAYKKISSKPEKFMVKSNKEGKNLVFNRKIGYLMEELTVVAEVDKNCSFRFLDEVVLDGGFSFTFNKQFTYKQLFNKYVQILLENGVNQKLYLDTHHGDHNTYCDRTREISALKVPAVVGLFFTLCLGIGIALVVFVIEILYKLF